MVQIAEHDKMGLQKNSGETIMTFTQQEITLCNEGGEGEGEENGKKD